MPIQVHLHYMAVELGTGFCLKHTFKLGLLEADVQSWIGHCR